MNKRTANIWSDLITLVNLLLFILISNYLILKYLSTDDVNGLNYEKNLKTGLTYTNGEFWGIIEPLIGGVFFFFSIYLILITILISVYHPIMIKRELVTKTRILICVSIFLIILLSLLFFLGKVSIVFLIPKKIFYILKNIKK